MLRHKAMIQCARIAFGYGGIYDQDEAERIVESIDATTGEVIQTKTAARPELPAWPEENFATQLPRWTKAVQAGLKSNADILSLARTKGTLTAEQEKSIKDIKAATSDDVTDVQPKGDPQAATAGGDDDLPWND
jgi:hypothetical protein